MYLAIDIGNTSVTFGYFESHILGGTFSISSNPPISADKAASLILMQLKERLGKEPDFTGIGISSVVPSLTDTYLLAAKNYLKVEPKLLSHNIDFGFRILYDNPAQLGTDRLANVIAASKLYGYPVLVIDLGTATKYDVIDSRGDYLGGIIAPGVRTSAEALFEKGSLLFQVELDRPENLIGKNTADALKSGIYYGFLGQMAWLVERIKLELGYPELRVVVTGGYAEQFRAELFYEVDSGLTLKGLEIALNH